MVAALAATSAPAPCGASGDVPAADLVAPALLSGPSHRVLPCARIEGHMARFVIESRHGVVVADSIDLLQVRVDEMASIDALDRAGYAELFADAALAEVTAPAGAIGRIALNPLDTMAGLPAGAARFFSLRASEIGARARNLGDRTTEAMTGADDAYDRPSLRPGVAPERDPRGRWYERGARRVRSLALDYIGYARARRDWARRLGVDPYSSNELLHARLDSLAWAALAGSKAAGTLIDALSSGAGSALRAVRRVDTAVWDLDAAELGERNRQRLLALGCGAVETRRFLRNGTFTPPLQTGLTDGLVELANRRGCVHVVELAAALRSEVEARYLVDTLRLLTTVEALRSAGWRFDLIGTSPVAIGDDGHIWLPLPADRFEWTPAVRAYFDQSLWHVPRKTILLARDASLLAQRGLTRRGFDLVFVARYGPQAVAAWIGTMRVPSGVPQCSSAKSSRQPPAAPAQLDSKRTVAWREAPAARLPAP